MESAPQSRDEDWRNLVRHVQSAPGHLAPKTRRAVFAAAAARSRANCPHTLPARLAEFVDTVAERAYRITDTAVDQLRDGGYSEDEIFEAIVVTSVGAAARRLDVARRAIEEA
ncbi:MAG: hypothetical protein ACRDS9_06600 [Pseudonocardiaceae bacterium]